MEEKEVFLSVDPPERKLYRPIFAGFTEEGKKLVLYAKDGRDQDFHIRRPTDDQLLALSPGANITWVTDMVNNYTTLVIASPEWSGTAKGSQKDAVEEPAV